ncbi:MAG: LGFP repeat-containing protein [Microbacterium sp.]|uniref:LGFP repeat-containing protein n=1 Tax=Microbacterium sp. TaxID=51671 RepID=UPI003A85AA87
MPSGYTAIRDKYDLLGGASGVLGPSTSDVRCTLRDGGCYQNFEGGSIHVTPSGGVFATTGAVRSAWRALGFENGDLGYPTTALRCESEDGSCVQEFEGGSVVVGADGRAVVNRP